jgi:outer membrane protein OmpA-like peptidoglycan-associated protein
MNTLEKIALLLMMVMTLSAPVLAQKSLEREGDKAFAVHNFARSVRLYSAALKKADDKEKRMELAYKTGLAYHRMNLFTSALQWYEDALGEERTNTMVLIAAADAALRNTEPEKAAEYLQRVIALNPLHEKAQQLSASIAKWKEHSSIPSAALQLSKGADGINSSYSDYAPRWLGNELVITSSRPTKDLVSGFDERTMQDYSRLYLFISRADDTFGDPIFMPVSKNRNAGVFAWDAAQKRAFFTWCDNRTQRCLILQSDFDPQTFSFSRPRIPTFVNKKYNYGHPFVTADGRTLYFSARMPGGYGGNDIYSISLKPDGSFGLPTNAGPLVNTAGEELFPATAGDSILFFSSNGHSGYGGLDLFATKISGSGHGKPQLLPPPINSTSDDFSLSLKPGLSNKGAFSSNRGGTGADNIYFFRGCPLPVLIEGRVEDATNSAVISDANINVVPDNQLQGIKTDAQGQFRFYCCAPQTISIEASAKGYRTARIELVLKTFSEPQTVLLKLHKMAWPAGLSGTVVHRETGKPISNQPIRLVRPGMAERITRTNAMGVYVFDTVPVNNIYTLKVEREGFFNESRVVNVPENERPVLLNRQNGYDLDFELTPIALKKEIVINNIYYDFDKASLRESSKMELGKLVSLMRDNPTVRIQINAHTDERGRAAYNERLSAMRAQSVVDYLVQSGIDASRLTAQGYGSRFPVVRNARTEQEHQSNRRTTFQVLDMNAPVQHVVGQNTSQAKRNNRLFYRVQFLITSTKRNPETDFIAITNLGSGIRVFEEATGMLYRYEAGDRFTLPEAEALRNQIRASGFPDCFLVPYIDNQRVSMQQARDFKP